MQSIRWHPDGSRLVTTHHDESPRVWMVDGSSPPRVLEGHTDVVFDASFSPDGQTIVTASKDRTVRLWNTGDGKEIDLMKHDDAVVFVSFTPDGSRILSGSVDQKIRLWRPQFDDPLQVFPAPGLEAHSIALSADGTLALVTTFAETAGEDIAPRFTAKLFDDVTPYSGVDDARLWSATRFCPSVEQRQELLGDSLSFATERFEQCQRRVTTALRR
jgi:WD40 repeat protein